MHVLLHLHFSTDFDKNDTKNNYHESTEQDDQLIL